MPVKALYDYDFPSKDRQEVYGDDILVNVMWTNNPMLCSAACFRTPKAMSWADFKAQMIDPWAASDPDYDPSAPVCHLSQLSLSGDVRYSPPSPSAKPYQFNTSGIVDPPQLPW